MTVDLYYTPLSSPCRAVLLTAEAIGLSLNLKEIDLFSGEHLKPEYEQYPVVFGNATEYNEERYKSLQGAFEVLDKFLDGQDYAAGRNLTIADLALVATVSTSEMFGFEVENYANVAKWMDRIKSCAPGYRKANVECLQMLKKFVEDKNKE
ncbi:Glutathione S-transferase 1-1 [Habropoda laboriosa]|uniref:Glutathione S-transferase 1-1 n=1 Tax=Habropoda laboriosa TaxID=597456 RepID=A0A0L7QP60_9HYME|nr:Glutathione S-transferase 1-1 [Habropoda laboriosa]